MRYSKRTRYGYKPYMPPPPPHHSALRLGRRFRFHLTAPVIMIAAVLVAGIVVGTAALLGVFGSAPTVQGGSSPTAQVAPDRKFPNGVTVNGVDLGGLMAAEAREKVETAQQTRAAAATVTLAFGNYKVQFQPDQVAVSFNTDEVLADALAAGAGSYTTDMTIDPSAIEADVRQFADSLLIQPFDAIVTAFNPAKPDGQRFTFSEDRPGQQVDGDALWAQVKQAYATGAFGTIEVTPVPVPAKATKASLEANSRLIVSFQSKMSDHSKERLKNITLAAETVSKRLIAPGEEWSFNDATGERTADKGYQVAHVLTSGVEDNGLGGGVCQVSGTLFNAAARAGLQIVKRYPHSIPSSYLKPPGSDATVDYPRKDLVIRNIYETPVIIVMKVDQQSPWKVTAEIYGVPLPAGQTIDLDCHVDQVLPKKDDVRYEDSEAVAPGETKVIQPRDGKVVTVYQVYKLNGVEQRREKIDTVTYQAYGTVMLYNPLDPKPSGLPTATPSATPKTTADPTRTPAPRTPTPAPTHSPTPEPAPTTPPASPPTDGGGTT